MSTADEYKALGNKAFSSGDYQEAIKQFTLGLEVDPSNYILYSNRSGAYSGAKDYAKALEDASKIIELKSDWPKGYSRRGAALHGLGRYEDAKAAYEQGLAIDPANAQLKNSLAEVERVLSTPAQASPFDNLFQGDVVSKIAANPKLAHMLSQPDLMAKIMDIQKNPENLSKYSSDPRVLSVMMGLMGIDTDMLNKNASNFDKKSESAPNSNPFEFAGEQDNTTKPQSSEKFPDTSAEKKNEKKQESEPEPMEVEDSEELKAKKQAEEQKLLGNAAYKKKNFEEAIKHYDAAIELNPIEITFYNNKSAVYFEMGDYQKCIEIAEMAADIGRENRADFKLIAKSFMRIGSAYHKLNDLDNAIKFYNKSLTEHRTADSLNKLKAAEKERKIKEEEAYLDEGLANEARERGNDFFKKSMFPEAVKEYTEATKRNPNDPRTYSNRAACYTKLMALPQAQSDVEKCLALDPTFIKAYLRKAAIQFLKREYAECLETCNTASEIDTEKKHAAEIQQQIQRTYTAINQQNSNQSNEEIMKRAQEDPEIIKIMSDPGMQVVLQQMQTDPRAVQEHLKNPEIAKSLRKLMAAGIVRMG